MVDCGQRYVTGTPMLQVYSVTITKNVESEICYEVCGTIGVTDGNGTYVLYDRRHDPESINPKGTGLTLTGGPSNGISASTGFTIHLDLTSPAQSFEIKRNICWDPKDTCYYDRLLSVDVAGKNAYATLNFGVFSVAKAAQVKIVLARKDATDGDNNDIDVYGTLVAYYANKFDCSTTTSDDTRNFKTLLFNQSAAHCLTLKLGEPIPLLTSAVALPVYASFVVEANLYQGGTNLPIVIGSTPKMLPTHYVQTQVAGERVVAQVNVGWRCPIGNNT